MTGANAGLHFYQLTATGAIDLGLAPITVTPVNHAPTLATITNQVTAPGATVTFTATGSDPDAGQTLTYSLTGAPAGATIDPATGAFTWTPTVAQGGRVDTFDVVATDDGSPTLSVAQPVTINVQNKLQAVSVTELAGPTPGPMQVAIDFNEALQPGPAQTVANYKIQAERGAVLPIQSAVYSVTGSTYQVVLTVVPGTAVAPDVYNVSIAAANLTATNGDPGAPKTDGLWVDVTGENTLKPIAVQGDGSFAVSGPGQFLGYPSPQQVIAGTFTGNPYADLVGHLPRLWP